MLRWIGFVFVVLLMIVSGYFGLADSLQMTQQAHGPGQWVVTATELAYSVCAVLALGAMAMRHGSATGFIRAWCVTSILTATLAPVAYGHTSPLIGLVSGVATTLLCALILWVWTYRPIGVRARKRSG